MSQYHKYQKSFPLVAAVLLLLVMGGRTALFVALFDAIARFGSADAQLTPFAVLFAVALVIAVPGSAFWRARAKKKAIRRYATVAMVGAALTDGYFNVAEALILAQDSAALAQFDGTGLQLFFDVGVVLIGVMPTLLTLALMQLVGSLDSEVKAGTQAAEAVRSGKGWPKKCVVCGEILFAARIAQGHWRANDHREWRVKNPKKERYIEAGG